MENADTILFHPSALGDIYTGVAKGWDVENSLTCKRKLLSIYREIKYGRYYDHSNKYTDKGNKQEETGITAYSLFRKKFFAKNNVRLENERLTGEIDILNLPETVDIKCPWSLETLPHSLTDKADPDYVLQGHGYMALSGASVHIIAYCLVNSTGDAIINEKKKLWYSMGCPDDTNKTYLEERIKIEKNMIYDMVQFKKDNPGFDIDCKEWEFDIPLNERIVEFKTARDEDVIQKIYSRIDACRQWMNSNLFSLHPETSI